MITGFIILAFSAYLIGAVPFSYIVGKLWGKDISKTGSGNIGATNVLRSCGKLPGALAYILDIGKGVGTFFVVAFLFTQLADFNLPHFMIPVTSLLAIVGHTKSVFLKFRGGKGVAVAAGIMAALLPVPFGLSMVIFFTVLGVTGIVSASSLSAALALTIFLPVQTLQAHRLPPVFSYCTKTQTENLTLMSVLTVLIFIYLVFKHRDNIKRLLKGEEKSFKRKQRD